MKMLFYVWKCDLIVFRVHGVFKRIVPWIWLRYDRARDAHFYCYLSSLTNTMFIWLHPGLGRYLSQPDATNERSTRLATTFCWQYLFFCWQLLFYLHSTFIFILIILFHLFRFGLYFSETHGNYMRLLYKQLNPFISHYMTLLDCFENLSNGWNFCILLNSDCCSSK